MKRSAPTLRNQTKMRNKYFINPAVEHEAAKVYKDGFPIYMMVGKLKKELKRTKPFPDPVIMQFCKAYWKHKPNAENPYPYFIKTFHMVSAEWHSTMQQAEHQKHKMDRAPVAQSIKDVLKGMFT